MKKRWIALLLTLVLVTGSFVMVAGAQVSAPNLDIEYCNLSFRDSVCIKYAVRENEADVKLLIWTAPEAEYTIGTEDADIATYYTEEIGGVSYMIFDYTELTAKQMADVVYARAYAKVGTVEYYGAVNKYSILQYAYNKLGKTATATSDAELKEMLVDMLVYGASAQKYFDYKEDRLATADWYQVKLTEGALEDGSAHGLYLSGDKVTLTAPATDTSGATFSYWADAAGNRVATTATFELTVGSKNAVYTPVYVKTSVGLDFFSNGDRTCCVDGMGDCEDTELIIPAVSPDGDIVTEISGSAFLGEAIISVTIPNTIEIIGSKAFYNCNELTDVYYDGTEEEWNLISIGSRNTALENATKHFYESPVETFTVTFMDYDGTVLKIETVESGNGATAPIVPTRENYTFTGWDKSFDNVISDLTIIATYTQITEPTIVIGTATGSVGEEVEIVFNLVNSPELYAMSLKIAFDDTALELVSAESGEAMNAFVYQAPSNLKNGANFIWYANDPATANGTVLRLVLKIKDTTAVGNYSISMTCDPDNTYDANDNDVNLDCVEGKIVVTK